MSVQLTNDLDLNKSDPLFRMRRQFVQTLSLIGVVLFGFGIILGVVFLSSGSAIGGNTANAVLFIVVLLIINVVSALLVSNERVGLASNLLIVAYLGVMIGSRTVPEMSFLMAVIASMIAVVQPRRRIYYPVAFLVIGWMSYLLYLSATTPDETALNERFRLLAYPISLFIISASARYFIRSIETSTRTTLHSRDLVYAAVDIGQITANFLTFEELFERTVELIQERFGYAHAQIYMVNGKQAELVASAGAGGAELLARGKSIEVGSQSVIGRVTQIGELQKVNETQKSGIYAQNELFPDARSELALPIVDGETVIGALDVQDKQLDAFGEIDIQALQVITGQLSAAIRNARLFEEQQTNLDENQRLYEEAQKNLQEIQRLNRMLTKSSWDEFIENQQNEVGVTLGEGDVELKADWTPRMIEASEIQNAIVDTEESENITAVPIVLRGEILGAIEVVADKNQANRGELLEMVQSVANQLAVSLENVRLFEEAQESAVREQRINKIVQLYQSADTVDDLLKITLAELSQTFAAEQGAIRLGALPEDKDGE